MTQRLKERYTELVQSGQLGEGINPHQIPQITKIVVNRGVGDASQNTRALDNYLQELSIITGQCAVVTRSKKAIASFKIRENVPVGVSVTLRGEKMYAFLDRLINLALPRIRDFQGISKKGFDGRGNYNIGLGEQLMFPEIEYEKVEQIRGLDISIVTSANNNNTASVLLKGLGMPFCN